MQTQEVIDYWIENAQDAHESCLHLQLGKKYHHALFFGHLRLESLT